MAVLFTVNGNPKRQEQIPAIHNADFANAPSALPAYPLKVSANNRYLVDQDNVPFFMVGDSAWMLISQPTNSDADIYLSNRQDKGFNTVMVMLLDHEYATNAPSNASGDAPFTGNVFTTPNEDYFAHADYIISAAAQRGMNVLLAPMYLGFGCGSQGWCAEVQAASLSDMTSWGQYVGTRYKNYANIIWIIDGDADPSIYPGVQNKINAFVAGLKQYDNVHLITAHNSRGQMAVTPWSGEAWLTLNNIYTNNISYPLAEAAYNYTPVLPFYAIETYYENEHSMTQQQLRAEGYWTFLSGGFGYVFGNCPVWNMGANPGWCDTPADWKASLDYPGSVNVTHMAMLFEPRAWQNLAPDWNHSVVPSGYGTFGDSDYATAARTSEGKLVIVYLPSVRTVTVDMSKLSGIVTARWFDPTNGTYAAISGFPLANSGTNQFTPPGTNSSGDGDWVLVLDANSLTASPTGTNTSQIQTSTRTNTPIFPTATWTNTPFGPTATRTLTATSTLDFSTATPTSPLTFPTLTFTPSGVSTVTPSVTVTAPGTAMFWTPTSTPISPEPNPSRTFLYCVVGVLLTAAMIGVLFYLLWIFRHLNQAR